MGMREYFLDTYALVEIIRGNPSYSPYASGISLATTNLNLMELYYHILLESGYSNANHYFEKFKKHCIMVTDDIVKDAARFRFLNKKKNLSYIDCIGYVMAQKNNVPFLTGDRQFKELPGVEFVQ